MKSHLLLHEVAMVYNATEIQCSNSLRRTFCSLKMEKPQQAVRVGLTKASVCCNSRGWSNRYEQLTDCITLLRRGALLLYVLAQPLRTETTHTEMRFRYIIFAPSYN